jgi:hypothetical protein
MGIWQPRFILYVSFHTKIPHNSKFFLSLKYHNFFPSPSNTPSALSPFTIHHHLQMFQTSQNHSKSHDSSLVVVLLQEYSKQNSYFPLFEANRPLFYILQSSILSPNPWEVVKNHVIGGTHDVLRAR